MKKIAFIIVCALIILTNLPPISWFLTENYAYSNFDGSFRTEESGGKGNSFLTCIRQYNHFLCEHPERETGDNNLYRTFTIKPWFFWEWREYIFHSERFQLPYLDPETLTGGK